jgi:hypothetical protein
MQKEQNRQANNFSIQFFLATLKKITRSDVSVHIQQILKQVQDDPSTLARTERSRSAQGWLNKQLIIKNYLKI